MGKARKAARKASKRELLERRARERVEKAEMERLEEKEREGMSDEERWGRRQGGKRAKAEGLNMEQMDMLQDIRKEREEKEWKEREEKERKEREEKEQTFKEAAMIRLEEERQERVQNEWEERVRKKIYERIRELEEKERMKKLRTMAKLPKPSDAAALANGNALWDTPPSPETMTAKHPTEGIALLNDGKKGQFVAEEKPSGEGDDLDGSARDMPSDNPSVETALHLNSDEALAEADVDTTSAQVKHASTADQFQDIYGDRFDADFSDSEAIVGTPILERDDSLESSFKFETYPSHNSDEEFVGSKPERESLFSDDLGGYRVQLSGLVRC